MCKSWHFIRFICEAQSGSPFGTRFLLLLLLLFLLLLSLSKLNLCRRYSYINDSTFDYSVFCVPTWMSIFPQTYRQQPLSMLTNNKLIQFWTIIYCSLLFICVSANHLLYTYFNGISNEIQSICFSCTSLHHICSLFALLMVPI